MLWSKTKDRMWKSKHYLDRSSGLLRVESAAPPPYSPDMSPCHEIKRTVQRPPFSNFKWPKLGHHLVYPRVELQCPTWCHQKASRSLEMCQRSQGDYTERRNVKIDLNDKFNWFLAVCALLLKWTSYRCWDCPITYLNSLPWCVHRLSDYPDYLSRC